MSNLLALSALVALATIACVSAWPIVRLTDAQAKDKGAVCLDGSNPAMYVGKANGTADANKWVLYIKGGGWCYDEASCVQRSKSSLGSTDPKYVKDDFAFAGIASDSPLENPLMASWNHVVLWYCDGASFSGDRTEPKQVGNTTLYFRGKRVLDAMLDVLLQDHGLDTATDVLLSGGSAGGLSTYLHADHVGTRLPSTVTKYKAAPNSGFFLLHNNAQGTPLYPSEMEYVYTMQNSTGGVNQHCAAALHGTKDAWRCIFANYSYAYSTTHMFPLQSSIDSWQMGSIWQGDKQCIAAITKGTGQCSTQDIADLNDYAVDLLDDYRRTTKFNSAGEGGFVESCIEHVAAQSNKFAEYAINGTVENKAFIKWWLSDGTEPAADHWYLPCRFNTAAPYQCNPSCGQHLEPQGCLPDDLECQ